GGARRSPFAAVRGAGSALFGGGPGLVAGGRRRVRHVGQDLGILRQVAGALGQARAVARAAVAGLLLARLRAHADRLALLALRGRREDADLDLRLLLVAAVLLLAIDLDGRAGLHVARAQHLVGERVLDVALDRAPQRPRAHCRIPALLDQQLLRVLGEVERQLAIGHRLAAPPQRQLDA